MFFLLFLHCNVTIRVSIQSFLSWRVWHDDEEFLLNRMHMSFVAGENEVSVFFDLPSTSFSS